MAAPSSILLKVVFNAEVIVNSFKKDLTFDQLKVHIRKLCRLHESQAMTLKWIDEEQDPITMSLDEEYREALRLFEANHDPNLEIHVFDSIPAGPGLMCKGEYAKIYRKGAKRRKKFYLNNGHKLEPKRFNPSAVCFYCKGRIWGLGQQGFKCVNCRLLLHKRCEMHIKHSCGEEARPPIIHQPPQIAFNNAGFNHEAGDGSIPPRPDRVGQAPQGRQIIVQGGNESRGRVTFEDFELLRVIGRGSYAKVFQVVYKPTQRLYAMKVINKSTIAQEDDLDWLQTEKKIFESASNHPFLVGLHSCFQTQNQLFFVIEYVNGGDLMYYMQRSLRLAENYVRFYSAEIAIALNFLHEHHIIYRDLKLDNVLMDSDGHIKITDFGMCKEGITQDTFATTFCGTPNYIAPEVISSQPYNFSVDWWALGVLMFEMLAGRSPWEGVGHSENPDQNTEDFLFQVILRRPIRFPRSISIQATNVLKGFLNKDPAQRLGCQPASSFEDIMRQPFFRHIDWNALENKQVPPPYKPELKDERDLTHFDPTFINESVHLSPDDKSAECAFDQSEFEGFEYVNPMLISQAAVV